MTPRYNTLEGFMKNALRFVFEHKYKCLDISTDVTPEHPEELYIRYDFSLLLDDDTGEYEDPQDYYDIINAIFEDYGIEWNDEGDYHESDCLSGSVRFSSIAAMCNAANAMLNDSVSLNMDMRLMRHGLLRSVQYKHFISGSQSHMIIESIYKSLQYMGIECSPDYVNGKVIITGDYEL